MPEKWLFRQLFRSTSPGSGVELLPKQYIVSLLLILQSSLNFSHSQQQLKSIGLKRNCEPFFVVKFVAITIYILKTLCSSGVPFVSQGENLSLCAFCSEKSPMFTCLLCFCRYKTSWKLEISRFCLWLLVNGSFANFENMFVPMPCKKPTIDVHPKSSTSEN